MGDRTSFSCIQRWAAQALKTGAGLFRGNARSHAAPTQQSGSSVDYRSAPSADCSLRPEWLDPAKYFPIPDWRLVGQWIETHPEIQHNELWCGVARNWAKEIARHFGSTCRVYESPNFFAVIPGELASGKRAMAFYEQLFQKLRSTLGPMALPKWLGKFAVFIAPDPETYYRYHSVYDAPGEHIQSGGSYINRGYGHVLLPSPSSTFDTRVLAHELCHALLCHHDLPLWLNEGVTQTVEIAIAGRTIPGDHHKPLPSHRDFWNAERIALLWSGRGFDTPGDTSSLSYDLSLLIVRGFLAIDRKRFAKAVNNAKRADAGFAAFYATYGQTPADFLSQFLGSGAWAAGHQLEAATEQPPADVLGEPHGPIPA